MDRPGVLHQLAWRGGGSLKDNHLGQVLPSRQAGKVPSLGFGGVEGLGLKGGVLASQSKGNGWVAKNPLFIRVSCLAEVPRHVSPHSMVRVSGIWR